MIDVVVSLETFIDGYKSASDRYRKLAEENNLSIPFPQQLVFDQVVSDLTWLVDRIASDCSDSV